MSFDAEFVSGLTQQSDSMFNAMKAKQTGAIRLVRSH
jgi:hypothetical protein